MLAFGYDVNQRVNPVGTPKPLVDPPGPTIAGTIDCRDSPRLEEQFMIQYGAFPTVMEGFFRMVRIFLPKVPSRAKTWCDVIRRLDFPLMGSVDALQNSQCYLVLGHDNSRGSMSLEKDKPSLNFHNLRHTGRPGYIRNTLIAMTHALDGVSVEPLFSVVVLLLGGLGMSGNGTGRRGATTHAGEILCGEGTEVHEGLVVLDGALLPRSLGSNPLATICALAERAVQMATERSGLSLDQTIKRQFETLWLRRSQAETEPRIGFSEAMEGVLKFEGRSSLLSLFMAITVSEENSVFTGNITGKRRCLALSADLLVINKGNFLLFQLDPTVPMQTKMIYDLTLISSAGESFHLHGTKTINTSIGLSPLKAWVPYSRIWVIWIAG